MAISDGTRGHALADDAAGKQLQYCQDAIQMEPTKGGLALMALPTAPPRRAVAHLERQPRDQPRRRCCLL